MNDQDKEAFLKWEDGVYFDGDRRPTTTLKEVWQAACLFKQKEIDELEQIVLNQNQENDLLWASNKKLQAENAKLRECVEFYANRKNWGGWNCYVGEKLRSMDTMRHDTEEGQDTDGFKCLIGGKKARETLAELDMPKVSNTEK